MKESKQETSNSTQRRIEFFAKHTEPLSWRELIHNCATLKPSSNKGRGKWIAISDRKELQAAIERGNQRLKELENLFTYATDLELQTELLARGAAITVDIHRHRLFTVLDRARFYADPCNYPRRYPLDLLLDKARQRCRVGA